MIRRRPSWLLLLLLVAFVGAGTVRAAHIHDPLATTTKDAGHCDFCLGLDRAPGPPSVVAAVLPPAFAATTRVLIPEFGFFSFEVAAANRPRGPPISLHD